MKAENTILTILGRKGMGKTMLILDILPEYPRIVVLDSTGEFDERQGFVAYHDLHGALNYFVSVESKPRFRLSYCPQDDASALRFLQAAWEASDYLLVIDEANIYMSSSHLPPVLASFVRRGRHRQIDQIYAAQRASSIHREVTSQSDVIVAFHQHEQRDVEYLRKEGFGNRADWLPHLQTHQAIVYAVDPLKVPLAVESRRIRKNPLTHQASLFSLPDRSEEGESDGSLDPDEPDDL